ncbi:FimB/Mfa2 family fimbrial subunit [Mucilaginibacter sp. UR6-1]|uniref:FimB/Mfa2 family fimbrial subunit n=1 Tax=Mucilaginibacter sp. UR6-1 TaxID=1435643 RepID=UPI001E4B3164|nr:FimB/Mfa2 family fimbrial subunit [Mucilaginibacter sp. UR6-1]MCC8407375.1 FimB/Mfa2 family fimbrial subunit [Mucilaginibacter sp. UR6-1]
MKKNILNILLVLCVAFGSCKKNSEQHSSCSDELHKITFTVSGFTTEITDIKTNSIKSSEVNTPAYESRYLQLLIYDDKGRLKANRSSGWGTPNNSFTESLPGGTYTVIFVGMIDYQNTGRSFLLESPYDLSFSNNYCYFRRVNVNTSSLLPESYYKRTTITIADSDISQTVSLDRISSQLEIVIKDAIPQKAESLGFTFNKPLPDAISISTGKPVYSRFPNNNSSYGIYYSKGFAFPDSVKGKTNVKFSAVFVADPVIKYTVQLSAYDGDSHLISSKLSDITFKPNKIVTLTGNLFGGNGTSNNNTNINIDPTWSSDVIEKEF